MMLIKEAKTAVNKNMIPMNMFSQRALERIEVLMRPSQSSQAGFLDANECVIDVCEADWATIKKLNLTFEQFADKLETVTQKATRKAQIDTQNSKADYFDIIKNGLVIDGLKVTWVSYMGWQGCPCCHFNNLSDWCGPQETLSDTDFTVTNVKTGQQIFFSELHIHLIRRHHFFEGHTKYRLDPEQCAKVLELKPGISYKPVYSSETVWQQVSGSSGGGRTFQDYIEGKEAKDFIKAGAQKILCMEDAHAWILGDKLMTISDHGLRTQLTIENTVMSFIHYGISFYERYERKFVEP
jgi:hypothetical protein